MITKRAKPVFLDSCTVLHFGNQTAILASNPFSPGLSGKAREEVENPGSAHNPIGIQPFHKAHHSGVPYAIYPASCKASHGDVFMMHVSFVDVLVKLATIK
ncbi:hypothetical protein BWQ96_05460 [Gracilariopsis chorda]|uniref:Uncharacterized protein n=1 Tax=Gracilariopsis chorda TaxID=448386 RepID=A0A2V3IUI9_9FLOR|nr:hypothetical protein BWQ96_05460 [Gracilariopsis chorda]|eukprot:PXF44790.1 hypothetical protein BWQ96_05460 [Gracilariopsis chorda]